ncbi:penicillin-binding transpeptidase domain-containing protein [Danxiaibacter flavus]|uniref:Beta-lactamase n=1 Tax=Danxiaibacter flavus TaxID=3049108 RepID=A0ABV3Z8C1_9BACT|nr:penicillin-binding transpeptidase domain-containing protein [Chitinophagaceae bacterium DXS]
MKKLYNVSLALVAFVMVFASCNQNNVTVDNSIQKYFDENKVTGTFGMFDNGQGQFTIYNLSRFKDSTYLPASTFKIVNSLVGLETGRISNENMVIKWDSVVRDVAAWNKDLTMKEAFKVSAVPYYQEVARRIGKDTMQHWLDTLGYGAKHGKAVIKTIDTFWLDNSVKVTADEQLGLVKKLYFDQLPFRKQTTQEIVKRVMLQEDNANYKLSYKTGWGYRENGNALGWIIGWIEENKHPYFFVLNVEGPKDTNPEVRINILKAVLKQYGFMEGKK